MGEAEIIVDSQQVIVHSVLYFYGDAANEDLSQQIAADVARHWNEPGGTIMINKKPYKVVFDVQGHWAPALSPEDIFYNTVQRNNYFRVESFSGTDISFVDGIGSNTGYFKLDNLLNNSTTAAHEYGHTIGLEHPRVLDIRGKGRPGIMYPRGTIVDPPYQYNPAAAPLEPGGTMNPFTRKVSMEDINSLRLHKLDYNSQGLATLGAFSSLWHEKHVA